MPPLRHGARQILNKIQEDTRDIREYARTDPDLVWELAKHIDELLEELEPKLQRAAPELEKRVQALEEVVRRLERQPFRRTGTG